MVGTIDISTKVPGVMLHIAEDASFATLRVQGSANAYAVGEALGISAQHIEGSDEYELKARSHETMKTLLQYLEKEKFIANVQLNEKLHAVAEQEFQTSQLHELDITEQNYPFVKFIVHDLDEGPIRSGDTNRFLLQFSTPDLENVPEPQNRMLRQQVETALKMLHAGGIDGDHAHLLKDGVINVTVGDRDEALHAIRLIHESGMCSARQEAEMQETAKKAFTPEPAIREPGHLREFAKEIGIQI